MNGIADPPSPKSRPPAISAAPSSPRRQRTVSFCDVGGLLEDTSSQSSTLVPSSPQVGTRDFASHNYSSTRRGSEPHNTFSRRGSEPYNTSSPPPVRRGSHALLTGLGGLLSPILQGQKRGSGDDLSKQRSRDSSNTFEMTAAGGLSPIQEPSAAPVVPVQMRRTGSRSSLQDVGGLLGSQTGVPPVPSLSVAPTAEVEKGPETTTAHLSPPINFSRTHKAER